MIQISIKISKFCYKTKKRQAFDSGYFRGKSHFKDDGIQNYLVFII